VFKCTDHEKAISCARFLNSRQFITASTDGTLRTWDNEGKAVDVYRGHVNNKNFVGLSVSHDGDWISCGSENSRIYTYFSSVTIPRFTTPFNAMNTLQVSIDTIWL
jgi:E3 ubiquitin-protein ligase RFWD2